MKLQEFRLLHSELVENYQYIEFHIEGIYAKLCGKDFYSGLCDVNKTNLHALIAMTRKAEYERGLTVLEGEYEKLNDICLRRNFWIHNCYIDLLYDEKRDCFKKQTDIEKMYEDLRNARCMRDLLYNKFMLIKDI